MGPALFGIELLGRDSADSAGTVDHQGLAGLPTAPARLAGQAYLAPWIQERTRAWSTCRQAAPAFRFLYHVTLGRSPANFHGPAPQQPQKLRAGPPPGHRLLLATTSAAGRPRRARQDGSSRP